MDTYHAIRVKALACVKDVGSDSSYYERKLWRWYSSTFATPLAEVMDIPLEDVLQHYWEYTYENMDPSLLDHEVEKLSMSEEEALAEELRLEQEQRELDEDVAAMERLELERRAKLEQAQAEPKPIPVDLAKTQGKFEFVTEAELEAEAEKLAQILTPPKRRI